MIADEGRPLTSPKSIEDYHSHQRYHSSSNSGEDMTAGDEIEMLEYGQDQKKKQKSKKQRLVTIKDFAAMLLLPILTIILTGVLMGVLIYIYTDANGKDVNYAPHGIRVTAAVSLVITLLKMCITGGIGYAVSEYKWVRLQNGGSLSLLDVYDACTRGVGGILRVIGAIRIDTIIIRTLILHLGLIVLGPISQVILKTTNDVTYCLDRSSALYYTNLSSIDITTLSKRTFDMRLNYGIQPDHLLLFGFDTAAINTSLGANYICDNEAINCTFSDIDFIHTRLECKPSSFETASIVNAKTGNVTTLPEYYKYNEANSSSYPKVPTVFYDASMHGRTFYDFTRASVPIEANDSIIPEIRARVGDQTMVRLSYQGRADNVTVRADQIQVDQCTIRSYHNNTILAVLNRRETEPIVQSSDLIQIDYDLLSNRTFWSSYPRGYPLLVLNAYSYQLSLMSTLTNMDQSALQDRIAASWVQTNQDRNTIDNLFKDMLHKTDVTIVLTDPANDILLPGWACYPNGTIFDLDPGAYCTFSLICFIPLLWWITMWIIALYQTNGISRGNSQIALLVTGLTAAAREKFRGMSHAGQNTLFRYANQVDITFGETKRAGGRPGHIGFGLQAELHPIRVRRRSFSHD